MESVSTVDVCVSLIGQIERSLECSLVTLATGSAEGTSPIPLLEQSMCLNIGLYNYVRIQASLLMHPHGSAGCVDKM